MLFSNRPNLAQDFTNDREKLARALRRVSVGGGTALYDALDESLEKIKRGTHDKKAILLITDGEDTSSYDTFDDATLAVRESELLVYCLGISPSRSGIFTESTPPTSRDPNRRGPGLGIPFPGIPGIPGLPGTRRRRPLQPQRRPNSRPNLDTVDMKVLNTFADASGGKAWLLSGNWTENRGSEIQQVLDEIAAELRNQYSIGYYPSHPLKDGKWHRMQIRTKNARYHVRARKDYFGG